MGLLDDFSELFTGINELSDEIRGLKDDFLSTVIEPGQELKDTVTDIAGSVTGSVTGAVSGAVSSLPVVDDVTTVVDDIATSN